MCKNEGIKAICTVRRPEQAQLLKDAGEKFVVCTSDKDYKRQLGGLAMKLKPTVTLECIAGDMVGEMLDFMGFNTTVIIYGMLSEKNAGGIKPVAFIGKNQRIEAFLLSHVLAPMSMFQFLDLIMKVEKMYG